MLIDNSRKKLLHAIIFFSQNTRFLGKVKLFKLLFFLDFAHYKETGRSVTGIDYFAWKMGPVPVKLHHELKSPKDDLAAAVEVTPSPASQGIGMWKFKPRLGFDSSLFTKREIRILEALAKQYYSSLANEMIEATHLERLPWHQIYEVEKRQRALIPYSLAAREEERDLIEQLANEEAEMVANFQ